VLVWWDWAVEVPVLVCASAENVQVLVCASAENVLVAPATSMPLAASASLSALECSGIIANCIVCCRLTIGARSSFF